MNSAEDNYSEFVEVDPSGRYGRYNEVLGKGASKTVYRAFDLYEGIEVAWNQVKVSNFLQNSDYLERLYSEIHLLKRLKHPNIMKLYASWADVSEMNVNFITEIFTSGTLRQYRHKHKIVNIRVVKDWCRQILSGLQYLHSQKLPVIHRDLKCDNIFVNGNHGEVKIGDLGLAAVLQNVSESHCVGTPEFMAPEVYNEKYNELVDIYSFGMCILEMVTFEYPYSECATPAQIYMKVTSGKKPDALYQVQDPEVFQFIEKCLADVSERLSARELLNDPFLQNQDFESNLTHCPRELDYIDDDWRHLILGLTHKTNSFGNNSFHENSDTSHVESEWSWLDNEHNDDEPEDDFPNLDIAIKGEKQEDGNLFFGLRISSEVQPRNIHFPFDLENDTALSVATEMVQQLDITDHDVTKIAEMIDWEIAVLVPNWRNGLEMEETPCFADGSFRQNCASNHTSSGSSTNRCENECGVNGRFEEYSDSTQNPELSIKSNNFQQEEYWNQHESFECSEIGSGDSHSSEEHGNIGDKQTRSEDKDLPREKSFTKSLSTSNSIALSSRELSVDYEHEINEEFRWLQAKYEEMEEIIKQHMKVHVEVAGEGGRSSLD